jgi:general stress protein YciG
VQQRLGTYQGFTRWHPRESNGHVEHRLNKKAWKGNGTMSAETNGTQSPAANERKAQVGGSQSPAPQSEKTSQELAPDRPPPPVEGEGRPKRPRGFAAMDRKQVSEIARKGGKAAHSAGTAHEFTSDEAREAGRKGGRATHAKRRRTGDEEPENKPRLEQERAKK